MPELNSNGDRPKDSLRISSEFGDMFDGERRIFENFLDFLLCFLESFWEDDAAEVLETFSGSIWAALQATAVVVVFVVLVKLVDARLDNGGLVLV